MKALDSKEQDYINKIQDDFLEPKKKAKRGRSAKKVTNCKHVDAKHYARGMCNYCYHVYGRDKMAT